MCDGAVIWSQQRALLPSLLMVSSISPSVGEKKISSSDILVMRKVIKIQNIFKLLIRNLNDVIKKGNTGENVTHSWNLGLCIINSRKHFTQNTIQIKEARSGATRLPTRESINDKWRHLLVLKLNTEFRARSSEASVS